MITPSSLAIILQGAPFPGATFTVTPGGAALDLVVNGVTITFCEGAWFATERRTAPAHLSFAATPTAEQVHAEIRRVLAVLAEPAPSWEQTKADCVGPDLPGDDPLYDRATAAQALARVTAKSFWEQIKGTYWVGPDLPDEIDHYHDANLRTVKALTTIAEVFGVDPADVGKVCEVVADQRRRVPELERERDAATSRADKLNDRLRRDDDLRSQIAVAVGLDDSASLALILDTVTRDRPGREISRLSGLLDVLAAPVAFGERRLSTAERAEWALRRWLAEGKECSARMAQLIDAEVYLDVLGVPAYAAVPSDDPGDASEALTLPERLRLHFGATS